MMKAGKLIYTSPKGLKVFDREDSHLHIHAEVLRQALEDYGLERSDMNDRNVEKLWLYGILREPQPCYLVPCAPEWETPNDAVYYERRGKRKGFSRMVRGVEPPPTNDLVLIMKKSGDHYIIITAYAGEPSPKEPWDTSIESPEEYAEALAFWSNHALIEH